MKRLLALLLLIALASPAWAGCGVEILSVDSDCGPVQIVGKAKKTGFGEFPDYTKVPQTDLLAWFQENMPYAPTSLGLNTYTRGPAHGEGDTAFSGAILVPSGKVILVPRDSDYVGIYDPETNTYTRGPAHLKGNSAYISGCYDPSSGKCYFSPYAASNIGIIRPIE